MSMSLGGSSRVGRVLGPSLDKIIKNVAWRKHSQLVATCKSVLDKLETLSDSSDPNSSSPVFGLSVSDAEFVLQPLMLALDSGSAKVMEPALECLFKLYSLGLIRGVTDGKWIIETVCKSAGSGDDAVDLALLKVLLSAVRSPCVYIRGEYLVHIVKTCYNVYLGSVNGTNQICAKAVLAQIMLIVVARMEEDSMEVGIRTVSVNELLEFTDRNLNEGNSIQIVQSFIYEVMEMGEGNASPVVEVPKGSKDDGKTEVDNGEIENGAESSVESVIREDGFLIFKNVCKLSMKFSSLEQSDDQILLRGKTLSLELLKVVMNNGGPIWRTNERQVICCLKIALLQLIPPLTLLSISNLGCEAVMLISFNSDINGHSKYNL